MTTDLRAWLTQIWDEHEARLSGPTFCGPVWPTTGQMLARIAADRQILAMHKPDRPLESWYWLERRCAACGEAWHKWLPDKHPTDIGPERGCRTVRLLALPHADRPGYREEWEVGAAAERQET